MLICTCVLSMHFLSLRVCARLCVFVRVYMLMCVCVCVLGCVSVCGCMNLCVLIVTACSSSVKVIDWIIPTDTLRISEY